MELIAGLIEGIIALFTALIDAVVGLFVEGAASLGGGEALGLLLILFIELFWWMILFIAEIIVSLFKWRKPRKVPKPIIWRPKKLRDSTAGNEDP